MVFRIIVASSLVAAGLSARAPQGHPAMTLAATKNATAASKPVPVLLNKTSNANSSAQGGEAKMDVAKLEKIEVNLKTVISKPHAPEGMKELLDNVQHAEAEVKAAKSEEVKTAVMKNISFQIQSFKKKLILRKQELEASKNADPVTDAMGVNVTVPKLPSNIESIDNITQFIVKKGNLTKEKASSLAPIVQQLEARLDHLEYQEKNAEMTQAEFAKREKKVNDKSMASHVGDREATKAKLLMKYLKRKTQRAYKKKMTEWKAEKKALHDAIDAIKVGKLDKLQAAMSRLNDVHAPKQQEFLH